ncbi:hypothetical protein A3B46_00990 [Candidatus Roizmanbacteria bacterium RIFCSPLOWO2_01_FULL_39_19]|nr:MAG: hypothetical protein A3B46_00990 [Candidatus Roizmanbacteria bacterium RIFCSPLOWO2_01_FULL_39_19]
MKPHNKIHGNVSVALILVFFITQVLPFFYRAQFTFPNRNFTIDTSSLSLAKYLLRPKNSNAQTVSFADLKDTLSNSRLSYRASIGSSGGTSGSSTVTIDTGDADQNTNHLFPRDVLCFSGSGLNGCQAQTTYTVANISSTTVFNLTTALSGGLMTNDFAIATQSAVHTIVFTTTSAVPTNGDILITIPAIQTSGKTNDGMPDTAATTANNGFDLNSLAAGDVSVSSSGCDNNWNTTETITAATGANDHTIRIDRATNSCAAGSTITVTVGTAGSTNAGKLINPAPINSGHTQGAADTYQINVKTRDGSDVTLDNGELVVAPVEAVLVSATVDEILNLTVAGVSSSTSTCGQTTDVTTTAYSVPWGTIASIATFYEAAQQLTVSTNADDGYSVTVEENDQMNKETDACDSPTSGTADYTDSCIQDTTCGASVCSESTSADWTDASTYFGLGYSLANVDGTDAGFTYNESSRTFSSKQVADQENSETKATIMTNAGPVSSKDIYVCYRISVSALQPAGYYQNVVKYTATATF